MRLIKSLENEHSRMTKLLCLLEREIDSFRAGNVIDYMLISSILDYLSGVGQYKLNLAEEEIFTLLVARDPDCTDVIGDICLEHEKLSFLCRTLSDAIRNIQDDNELPRMWLVSVAREFCLVMRRHLEVEDTIFLPLAKRKLSNEDWENIQLRVAEKGAGDFHLMEDESLLMLRRDIHSWHRDQHFNG